MGNVKVIGLDLAKNVFQLHGVDADGAVVLRQRLTRARMLKLFGKKQSREDSIVPGSRAAEPLDLRKRPFRDLAQSTHAGGHARLPRSAIGLRLGRVVRRAVTGLGRTRPDMADGCPERLSSLPEFIRYIWTTRNSARVKIVRLAAAAPSGCRIVHLRSDQDVTHFLHTFPGSIAPLRA